MRTEIRHSVSPRHPSCPRVSIKVVCYREPATCLTTSPPYRLMDSLTSRSVPDLLPCFGVSMNTRRLLVVVALLASCSVLLRADDESKAPVKSKSAVFDN